MLENIIMEFYFTKAIILVMKFFGRGVIWESGRGEERGNRKVISISKNMYRKKFVFMVLKIDKGTKLN